MLDRPVVEALRPEVPGISEHDFAAIEQKRVIESRKSGKALLDRQFAHRVPDRRNLDAVDNQTELLNQQISELQAAAAANAEQIRLLASQLKDVVAALEQAGLAAAAERAATRRLAVVALALAVMGLTTGILALIY